MNKRPPRIAHYIQREILRSLSRTTSLRYSELRPEGLESNLFIYHLKQLIAQGMVKKEGAAYSLSADGMRYVNQMTKVDLNHFAQPKLISALVIANNQGEYVMHRRPAQPFMGRYTFPGGILLFNEDLEVHVKNRLKTKVGLDIPLEHRGLATIRLGVHGEVLAHTHVMIFTGSVEGRPELSSASTHFAPEWVNPSRESKEVLPDVPLILQKLEESQSYFFLDINLMIDEDL